MQLETNYELVEDRGDFTPFQPGDYEMALSKTDYVENKSKNGYMFKYTAQICDGGEFNGRMCFGNLNVKHPNPETVKIADKEMKEILLALKIAYYDASGTFINTFNGDTATMENIPFIASIAIEPASEEKVNGVPTGKIFPAKNVIKKYKPLAAQSAQPATVSVQPTQTVVQQNPNPQSVATAGVGTVAANGVKPALPNFLANKAK